MRTDRCPNSGFLHVPSLGWPLVSGRPVEVFLGRFVAAATWDSRRCESWTISSLSLDADTLVQPMSARANSGLGVSESWWNDEGAEGVASSQDRWRPRRVDPSEWAPRICRHELTRLWAFLNDSDSGLGGRGSPRYWLGSCIQACGKTEFAGRFRFSEHT